MSSFDTPFQDHKIHQNGSRQLMGKMNGSENGSENGSKKCMSGKKVPTIAPVAPYGPSKGGVPSCGPSKGYSGPSKGESGPSKGYSGRDRRLLAYKSGSKSTSASVP